MEITTKRNVGMDVWTISDNKAKKFTIGRVMVSISETNVTESYFEENNYSCYDSEKCFDTKDELIAYIFNQIAFE